MPPPAVFRFGPLNIPLSQVFLVSKLSFALVNLKPVRPGHVLLAARRPVARFNDLTHPEVVDLFLQAQRISKIVERITSAESLTLCIQDGAKAGQSVPHVHLHLIPRFEGDFANNDDIYDAMAHQPRVDNPNRSPRSPDDMAAEALRLRAEIGPSWDTQ
ncbi:Dinucleoside triphosphate hydrolase [Coemansia thaxteri]|uniref:Bis(5'-adenosyl)-triphosphatase n=1 Tax=Coemansia thaxteri TaxID=2663907 RepID=A0A9W8BNF2_9FUNG|nr:Dinucleoside triphosphate hydrolase [Coemansia thaxteri]KAJ2008862.1 Dinucleoside triphosphate hydrolase [Coemansia thaxteri]KAJ2473434.1 Dinucleoside triphosphate hydrolase [Coemansia sp. RSA 2322]